LTNRHNTFNKNKQSYFVSAEALRARLKGDSALFPPPFPPSGEIASCAACEQLITLQHALIPAVSREPAQGAEIQKDG